MKIKKYFIILIMTLVIAFGLLAVQNVSAVSPPGMVAHWKFDEGIGSNAFDETINDNDGTLSGGKFGGCLEFDGLNDFLEVSDSDELDVTGPITVEAWIKPYSIPATGDCMVLSKYNHYINDRSYLLHIRDGLLSFSLSSLGTNYDIASAGDMTGYIGEWVHIAGTFDGTNFHLYIDGSPQTTSVTTTGIYASTAPLYIGAYLPIDLRPFHGQIDEVRVSDIDISSFDLINPPGSTNAVALWHFDEGSGQTAADSAGSNDAAQLGSTSGSDVNDPTWIAPGPTWTTRGTGFALCFDGVDDVVYIDNEPNFDFDYDDAFSLEAWFMTESDDVINIISKYDNDPPHAGYQLIKHGSSWGNALYFFLTNTYAYPGGNQIRCYGTTDVADGEWHHVVVTYDGSGSLTGVNIYLDGVPETLSSTADTVTSDTTNDLPLQISGRDGTNFVFDGCIDDVKIWSGELQPPIADANGPYSMYEGDCLDTAITLDASGSYDSDGTIELYEWDLNGNGIFGEFAIDAETSNDYLFTNYFDSLPAGLYDVYLRVTDDNGLKNTDLACVTINAPQADLDLIKTVSAGDVFIGDEVTYTICVTNNGPCPADNVVITDPNYGSSCPTTILSGETICWQYEETYDTIGTVANTATVSSDTSDPDSCNNADTAGVNVYQLDVTKTATTSFNRYWDWTISKEESGGVNLIYLYKSGLSPDTYMANYEVDLDATSTDADWQVDGYIYIDNNAPIDAVINSVTDLVSPDIYPCVDMGVSFPYTLPAGGSLCGTYSTSLTNDASRTNTVTAKIQNYDYEPWDITGSWEFDFELSGTWYTHVDNLVQTGNLISGSGTSAGNNVYTITGYVDGNNVVMTFEYQSGAAINAYGTYSAFPSGQISGTISGTWTDTEGHSGIWVTSLGLASGGPTTDGETDFSSSVDVIFSNIPDNIYDECVDVTDDKVGFLGTYCEDVTPVTILYSYTIGPYSDVGTYIFTNTVTYVTNDNSNTDSDSWTITVVVLPYSDLTNSGLCPDFDREPGTDGDQFRLIFTPDINGDPNLYKISATNPGQFYYNIFHIGDISPSEPFIITIPYPFITKGANPVHIYSGVDNSLGFYVPEDDITDDFEISNFGSALYFDEGHDYLDFGDEFEFKNNQDFTAECWVNTAQTPPDQVEIMGTYGDAPTYPTPNQFWGLFLETTGQAKFYLRTNSGANTAIALSSTIISDGEWHHVACVKDTSTNEIRIYVDGVLEQTESFVDGKTENNYPFRIGDGHWNRWYHGYVDEVRISDSVRYTTSFSPDGPFVLDGDTEALWHFDEGAGQDVYDATGPYNGFLGSNPSEDENDPSWTDPNLFIIPLSSDSGFFYINIHLDYGLKQTGGYEQHLFKEDPSDIIWRSHAAIGDTIVIYDLTDYTFCVSGPVNDCQTMQNRNEFKKIRGIAGFILGALEDDEVEIAGPEWTVTVLVDEDGYYGYSFHHKGKRADYTVDPVITYGPKTVQLKAGKFAEVNFP